MGWLFIISELLKSNKLGVKLSVICYYPFILRDHCINGLGYNKYYFD